MNKVIHHSTGITPTCGVTAREPRCDDDLIAVTCVGCLNALHTQLIKALRYDVQELRTQIKIAVPQLRLTGATSLQQAALADLQQALGGWLDSIGYPA